MTKNGTIFEWIPGDEMSLIKNSLSARIESLGTNLCKIPQSLTIFLSDVEATYKSLTNVMTPFGAVPTRLFIRAIYESFWPNRDSQTTATKVCLQSEIILQFVNVVEQFGRHDLFFLHFSFHQLHI